MSGKNCVCSRDELMPVGRNIWVNWNLHSGSSPTIHLGTGTAVGNNEGNASGRIVKGGKTYKWSYTLSGFKCCVSGASIEFGWNWIVLDSELNNLDGFPYRLIDVRWNNSFHAVEVSRVEALLSDEFRIVELYRGDYSIAPRKGTEHYDYLRLLKPLAFPEEERLPEREIRRILNVDRAYFAQVMSGHGFAVEEHGWFKKKFVKDGISTRMDIFVHLLDKEQMIETWVKEGTVMQFRGDRIDPPVPGKWEDDLDLALKEIEEFLSKHKFCKECGSMLVTRKVKRKLNKGVQFYGCSSFPSCKYTESIREG